jgi:hypothetical protein
MTHSLETRIIRMYICHTLMHDVRGLFQDLMYDATSVVDAEAVAENREWCPGMVTGDLAATGGRKAETMITTKRPRNP